MVTVDDVVSEGVVVCSDKPKHPAPRPLALKRGCGLSKVGPTSSTMTGSNPRESIISSSQTEPSYSAEDVSFQTK